MQKQKQMYLLIWFAGVTQELFSEPDDLGFLKIETSAKAREACFKDPEMSKKRK